VGNVIKSTEHGEVDLRVEVESRGEDWAVLHFCASDSGIGSPQAKEQIEAKAGANSDGRLSSHPPTRERRLRAERIADSLAAFQPVIADAPEFEAAQAEVLRYDAVYEAVTGESVSRPPRQPPKLVRPTHQLPRSCQVGA